MKILPSSESDKCGLLNALFISSDKKYLYNIPENVYDSYFNGRIQNVIDCKTNADWPSSQDKLYFEITLYQLAIKPSYISLTRRGEVGYPAGAVLEGFYHSKWEEICPTSISFKTSNEVAVKKCKSKKFYTAFRYRQTKNLGSLKYIEFNSFDIFGEMHYFDHIKNCTPNRYSRRCDHFVFVMISFVMS